MIKTTCPLLLAAALGCASDVDLPLDTDPPPGSPPTSNPDPGDGSDPTTEPSLPPPAGPELVWSKTDFLERGAVSDAAWTTDGGLVAAVALQRWLYSPAPGEFERVSATLARYGRDGALEWELDAPPGQLFTDVAATAGGGVAVGLRHDVLISEDLEPVGIDWYDASGALAASWRPTSQETGVGPLIHIQKVQPLPDGSVFWAGLSGTSADVPGNPAVGLLDADRQLRWAAPLSRSFLDASAVSDVALTADGDVVVLAQASTEWETRSYVLELGPDGSENWQAEFQTGQADQVVVAPSGAVVAVGTIGLDGLVAVGTGPHLWGPYPERPAYSVELDPTGQPTALQKLELPDAIHDGDDEVVVFDVSMRGDRLVVAGTYDTGSEYGYFVTTSDLDGALADYMRFPIRDGERFGDPGPRAAGVAPDGRLALAGDFSGFVDFGDGEITSGVDEAGEPLVVPFIAVFDPADGEVD